MLLSIDIDVLRQEAELARISGREIRLPPDEVLALLERVNARTDLLEERIEALEDELRDEKDAHRYWEARSEDADDFFNQVSAKVESVVTDLKELLK